MDLIACSLQITRGEMPLKYMDSWAIYYLACKQQAVGPVLVSYLRQDHSPLKVYWL